MAVLYHGRTPNAEDLFPFLPGNLQELGVGPKDQGIDRDRLQKITPDVDLVILDMIMPVMDGLTALKSIRKLYPQTKVLVATGYAAPERLAAIKTIGIDGLLRKPFPLKELTGTVREILDAIAA